MFCLWHVMYMLMQCAIHKQTKMNPKCVCQDLPTAVFRWEPNRVGGYLALHQQLRRRQSGIILDAGTKVYTYWVRNDDTITGAYFFTNLFQTSISREGRLGLTHSIVSIYTSDYSLVPTQYVVARLVVIFFFFADRPLCGNLGWSMPSSFSTLYSVQM